MGRGTVAVDGVEQALVLVAGVEAVGIDLGQRAVGRERQILQVAGKAEQRRVTGVGVDARHDHGVGADTHATVATVPAQQQDVDPLLRAERVGAVVHRRRHAVVGEDPGDEVALGGRHAGGQEHGSGDGDDQDGDDGGAQQVPAARGSRWQQHAVAGDDHHQPQQADERDPSGDPEEPAGVDRDAQGGSPSTGRQPHASGEQEQEHQQGDGAELATAGREERRPREDGVDNSEA
jgi:hypothetical protein